MEILLLIYTYLLVDVRYKRTKALTLTLLCMQLEKHTYTLFF